MSNPDFLFGGKFRAEALENWSHSAAQILLNILRCSVRAEMLQIFKVINNLKVVSKWLFNFQDDYF